MNGKWFCRTALVCLLSGTVGASAQQRTAVRLRFDQAQREEVSDLPAPVADTAAGRPFACKLNRRRVSCEEAYDAVTLWNVRRVRVKNRRMRLSDTTRREKVKLLKFFIERDRRKGARPHLLGNVAGYKWRTFVRENDRMRDAPPHISRYTLRREYDSVRTAGGKVPDELWHTLSPEARYELNGVTVPGGVFQFIDGLILRTLDIRTGDADPPADAVVTGRTYPDRMPLVILDGERSSIDRWLAMCSSGVFSDSAEAGTPYFYYFYMFPLEAVQLYGRAGIYGAICINMEE